MFMIRNVHILAKKFSRIRFISTSLPRTEEISEKYIDEILTSDIEYNQLTNEFIPLSKSHKCLVLQPFVKWGPRKLTITPSEQLEEAVALIKTLPSWNVADTIAVPLESLDRKTLFKSGTMERLKNMIQKSPDITAVFVNTSNMKRVTSDILHENFRIPILDRYRVVIQILKIHATTKHAKLQVALAELYFIRRKAETDRVFATADKEKLKLIFQSREQKLKKAIQRLRDERKLLRSNRRKLDYPTVAVVGYTNAGKTCLIKALTGEKSLQPRNQLFATLDVTVHSGVLPSGLKVLYVDTVGFLTDLPTNLLECFNATLEDAVLADVILHIQDLASTCFEYKRDHVVKTLLDLGSETDDVDITDKIFNVGNKCDLINDIKDDKLLRISAKLNIGLNELREELEKLILKTTSRHLMTIKVENGGHEIRWLYKNATVVSEHADENNSQRINAKVIITDSNLQKFKHAFLKRK
ncbi:unnamed protein product [Phyllotreta striolata]|uniref:Hflx-type G domain-containing protein n=1 Tax=Phyllotreta striolata TaxID=444603 RepID=A0A9N9TEY5_PHYSR|nr:unnamed protein product [Phyllotreta striolata]